MSEPTPESATNAMDDDAMGGLSSDGLSGDAAGEEPSMEDILASIRKIIADDSDPVPLDGPAVAVSTDMLRPTPVPTELPPLDLTETAEQADADALDIEALLSDIQVAEPETPPRAEAQDDPGGVPVFNAASPAPGLDDELSIPDAPAEDIAPSVDADGSEDDVDRLMNELLTEMEELPAGLMSDAAMADVTEVNEVAVAPVETVESDTLPDITFDAEGDDELDLVKTLMADLTDDDETDVADMLAVDSVVEADGTLDLDVAESIEEPETDILDSILNMTLADEIASGPDAALSAAMEVQAETLPSDDVRTEDDHPVAAIEVDAVQLISTTTVTQTVDEVVERDDAAKEVSPAPSLAAIAAAAEGDVDDDNLTIDGPLDESADDASVVEAVALLSGTASDELEPEFETETSATDQPVAPEPSPADTPELETSMPRAVRSDAIIDDVTEEATMSAFAQLNQVVEDKAILTERGPRIGDLVQDALKPMLKEWLDENLQAIVERAVAKEVKRLSNGK